MNCILSYAMVGRCENVFSHVGWYLNVASDRYSNKHYSTVQTSRPELGSCSSCGSSVWQLWQLSQLSQLWKMPFEIYLHVLNT